MTKWSKAAKERAGARRIYRLEEAEACVPAILEEEGCDHEGAVMQKRALSYRVAGCCEANRRGPGYLHMPLIENTLVEPVNHKFVLNNWSVLCIRLAASGAYIIWEGGKRGGVRLGTLEEYQEQQKTVGAIAQGVVDIRNTRSNIINKAGGEADYMDVSNLLADPNE